MNRPDSLILDMDGTLWDNVDTYAKCWTIAMQRLNKNIIVTRDDIMGLMGKEARDLLNSVVPEWTETEQDILFDKVTEVYHELVPVMTPIIYGGVNEGLDLLSKKYNIFLLSNCEKDGLVHFMNHTKTRQYVTDYMEHGMNNKPKHHNIGLLIKKHNIKSTVYIGDTDSDSHEAQLAGVPFVWATYGFGTTENYSLKFDSFNDIVEYYLNIADTE